jgi:ribosomal protein S18 acetylase RimI-like enzyme
LFHVARLTPQHERAGFHSGSAELDRYFLEQVGQDVRRRVSTCFIALTDEQRVAGYYTLASTGIVLNELPPALLKKLPRYPTVPAIRMGRLAVDKDYRGKGLGAALLADALRRACHAEIAAFALLVDAKDKLAAAFYVHHGFCPLIATPLTLFLPLAAARTLL